MKPILITIICVVTSALRIKITPTKLIKNESKETILLILLSHSLLYPDAKLLARLLTSQEYDFQSLYDDIDETDDRHMALGLLYPDTSLHENLFSVAKLLTNRYLAYHVVFPSKTPYSANLVTTTSSQVLMLFNALSRMNMLRSFLVQSAIKRQMGNMETLQWLRDYLYDVEPDVASRMIAVIPSDEITPDVLATIFKRLGFTTKFLQRYLGDRIVSIIVLLERLLMTSLVFGSKKVHLSPSGQAIYDDAWKMIRCSRFDFGEKVSGQDFYEFAVNFVQKKVPMGGEKMDGILFTLCQWALSINDRSYWGMLTRIILIVNDSRFTNWYLYKVRQRNVSPLTFLSFCDRFPAKCVEAKRKGLLSHLPPPYFPTTFYNANKIGRVWMRAGHFEILTSDDMYYDSLADLEEEILYYAKLPWNGWISERNSSRKLWVGDALILKLATILDQPSLIYSPSTLTCLIMTIPYLIVSKKQLDLTVFFGELKDNPTWDEFYFQLGIRFFPCVNCREMSSIVDQFEDYNIPEFFTVKALRKSIDSKH